MPVRRDLQSTKPPRITPKSDSTRSSHGSRAAPGSPAQLLQMQRQVGNRAVQSSVQRETAGEEEDIQRQPATTGTLQREPQSQPRELLGGTGPLLPANKTPAEERRRQVTELIRHAEIASADFKRVMNQAIAYVNSKVPGGCENGDPGFQYVTKGLDSAIDKANGRMEGNQTVADMKDVLRGTIKCHNMEAVQAAKKFLTDRATSLMQLTQIRTGPTEVKSGLQSGIDKSPGQLVGYGDMKFLTPIIHWLLNAPVNGAPSVTADFWMYAEIQIMTTEMNRLKMEEGGHLFYDLTREKEAIVPPKGDLVMRLRATQDTSKAAKKMLGIDMPPKWKANRLRDLKRGLNAKQLASVLSKLEQLKNGTPIELTKGEWDGLALAGELVYIEERLESNFQRQGIGAGAMTGGWTNPKPVTQGWNPQPTRPRSNDL